MLSENFREISLPSQSPQTCPNGRFGGVLFGPPMGRSGNQIAWDLTVRTLMGRR